MADTNFNKINEVMDLDRTNQLFDSSIERAGSNNKGAYTQDDMKQQRLVIGFGNLHISTAKVQLGVVRMRGYIDNSKKLKESIDRKIRKETKYGRKAD